MVITLMILAELACSSLFIQVSKFLPKIAAQIPFPYSKYPQINTTKMASCCSNCIIPLLILFKKKRPYNLKNDTKEEFDHSRINYFPFKLQLFCSQIHHEKLWCMTGKLI